MKKLLAILIVATMMLCLSVSAFAELTTNGATQNVTATYTSNERFSVTIPATVSIGGGSLPITANTNYINSGSAIDIRMSSSNYEGNGLWRAYEINDSQNEKYIYPVLFT